MDYREEFYAARWHLDVAKRMLVGFDEYGSKRFLVGVIREGARCTGKLVRSFLIREKTKGDFSTFLIKVAPDNLQDFEIGALIGILNIEKDQRRARVEILKGDSILMEVNGKWRVLKISRLREFIGIVDDIISNF